MTDYQILCATLKKIAKAAKIGDQFVIKIKNEVSIIDLTGHGIEISGPMKKMFEGLY
jgi:hypothetical protein